MVSGQQEAVPGTLLSWGRPCKAETLTQEESAGEGLEGLTGTPAYSLCARAPLPHTPLFPQPSQCARPHRRRVLEPACWGQAEGTGKRAEGLLRCWC